MPPIGSPLTCFNIGFEVIHHRLIDAVAFVRRRTEGDLDHGIDAEEWESWSGPANAGFWSLETMRSVVRITRLAAMARSISMNCRPSIWALP